ncbi:DUF2254 domain-containing protein [Thalassobacillus sp. CUG 92003]|uniref:DUF2254 domain-containing protein n=1 Tax=Thalassobacillus sp. CUG 92003 TaxID=2736641 RepID=UPI0015E72EEB|nr:DUF2254 domain-containing protein [Thalassobacillus sp. CUG 92003]
MLAALLPKPVLKYIQMSKYQMKYELQMTLWFIPLIYILASSLLVVLTLYLDLQLNISAYVPEFFQAEGQATRTLVSTLIGGILTLSAFTLNSLLVVLTMLSGQFSPRMLFDFISNRGTQHILGIFHGSFIYVLFVFLFITNQGDEMYVAVPFTTVSLAFITIVVFIFFINHASSWMQVHNFTYSMKNISKAAVQDTMRDYLEKHGTEKPGNLMEAYQGKTEVVTSPEPGYLQMINFKDMINEARKDDVIIRLYAKIGDFTLKHNRLFAVWGPGKETADLDKYNHMIEIGYKETEVQEVKMGITKLSEVAVKAIGNSDPKTAVSAIHQMADLVVSIEGDMTFTSYLQDEDRQTRVIMSAEDFEYFMYVGFGYIRHYAGHNYVIITEIIVALGKMAQTISSDKLDSIWEFGSNSIDHISQHFIFKLDKRYLLSKVYELALYTNHEMDYYAVEKRLNQTEPDHL